MPDRGGKGEPATLPFIYLEFRQIAFGKTDLFASVERWTLDHVCLFVCLFIYLFICLFLVYLFIGVTRHATSRHVAARRKRGAPIARPRYDIRLRLGLAFRCGARDFERNTPVASKFTATGYEGSHLVKYH